MKDEYFDQGVLTDENDDYALRSTVNFLNIQNRCNLF